MIISADEEMIKNFYKFIEKNNLPLSKSNLIYPIPFSISIGKKIIIIIPSYNCFISDKNPHNLHQSSNFPNDKLCSMRRKYLEKLGYEVKEFNVFQYSEKVKSLDSNDIPDVFNFLFSDIH